MEFETGLVPNSNEQSVPTTLVTVQQYSIAKDRERRTIKPPQKYGEVNLVTYALSIENNIESNEKSSTYEEAVSCSDLGKWMIAMQEDMESFIKMGHRTW